MTAEDVLSALPAREGHFLLESGYHSDLWLSPEAVFVRPRRAAPLVSALAERLRPHGVSAICGPLLGGAFLAHALAIELALDFHFAERVPAASAPGLFRAEYRLPDAPGGSLDGARVALVDDVISAGSSVRATAAALADAGAEVAVVGTLLALGRVGLDHFGQLGVPVEALGHRDFAMWTPDTCPLCRAGAPLVTPA
jgi:orotate phosphoribosyltransferase